MHHTTDPQTRRSPAIAGPGFEIAQAGRLVRDPNLTTVSLPPAVLAPRRRLPAFGKDVAAELAAGHPMNLFAFIGPRSWALAERRRYVHGTGAALVLPPDLAPEAAIWPAVDSLCLHVEGIDRADAIRTAQAIVSSGVRCVVVLGDHSALVRSALPGGAA